MVEDKKQDSSVQILSTEEWLIRAKGLVPTALHLARQVNVFPSKWKVIISKLEQIPPQLSHLSTHPCFSKNPLCNEQLQAVSKTLNEAIELAQSCVDEKYEGKLRMQSNLDSLIGNLDLNLRDCGLLIKTGVLAEVTFSSGPANHGCIKELLARLQIGDLEAKRKALDSLVGIMEDDEKELFAVMGRSNIAALIRLLVGPSLKIREKTVSVICSLSESGIFDNWLILENVISPLVRLVDSGSSFCKEKATISLQRLSISVETSRSIVDNNGIKPLIEICTSVDSITQAAAACTLRNISVVPELRQKLAEEGIVKAMVFLLDRAVLSSSKEYAAECLQNLTINSDDVKKSVFLEGGITSLLKYLDSPLPQEPAVGVLKNLADSFSTDKLISLGILARLARVLEMGSLGARQAAASAICGVCVSGENKRLVGESGCISSLVKMLEAKNNEAREVAARAIASLMSISCNCKLVKREEKSVPSLVALLDSGPHNTAKKYAVSCLVMMSLSKKCRRMMISYGAIGYLKKLVDMDIPGAKKLLESLEMGKLKRLLSTGK
ncbi:U-box domain-containing protein 4 [Phtheirospermum japonicum]|uniref:U-box domain-containing protein 4 n=1 Tax=Phtheirospermum japonicum TaxID=374723 RepID=A0A830BV70_9LAMI|nr:U-box domain-containing protein 4 [Phtheirospermum japonicum]